MDNHKTGIIYLEFVGVSKDGAYIYYNPLFSPNTVKVKAHRKHVKTVIINKEK